MGSEPVVLVQMPFAAVERPSLGLGLLSASLNQAGMATRVEYANLDFAEQVGLPRYRLVEVTRNDDLLGEWVFAPAAFGSDTPHQADFFDCVDLSAATQRLGSRQALVEAFGWLREQASAWIDQLARRLLAGAPRIVGASSMFQQHCASLAILRRLKQLDPSLQVMLGGANCDGVMGRASFEAFPWLDWVVCGEADQLIVQVMHTALQGGEWPLPEGVLARQRGSTAERKPVLQLDTLPTPDFTHYFARLQASPLEPHITPGLLLETSRGCWWGQKHHCTFCGLNASGMNFRSKSAPRILEELDQLASSYGLNQFELTDNILAMERFRDLLPALRDSPYTLFAEVKANLRRDQMQALAEAGVRWIQPGLENFDDRVLRLMDKGTTAAVNLQLLKWAREFGIFVSWNFLAGFPGEQDEWYTEMVEWLPWLSHLQPPQGVFRARFDRYSPYQSDPARFGLKLRPHPAYAAIYPVSAELLADLAYFHLGTEQEWAPQLWDPAHMGPGLGALDQLTRRWGKAFWASTPVILSMADNGEQLNILDTRPQAQQRRHSLKGAERLLYLACEVARPARTCAQQAELSADQAEPILSRWCSQGLMLKLAEDRYLALAVAGELPRLLRPEEFPGGACKTAPALG